MKVLPWHAACISTRQERKTREASDLTDIRVVLKWLAENDMMIKFPRTDKKMRKMHVSMLGKLYMNHEELRPLISSTTTLAKLRPPWSSMGALVISRMIEVGAARDSPWNRMLWVPTWITDCDVTRRCEKCISQCWGSCISIMKS